jgi:ribosomal protein S18 acetylase RimI-like enzyme
VNGSLEARLARPITMMGRARSRASAYHPAVDVVVRALEALDATACDAIVLGLPYHFGDEGGRRDCAAAVRSQRGLVAEDGGDVVGFVTLEPRFEDALEITWMAVRVDRRGQGIGRTLIERVAADAVDEGRTFLLTLTVSPNDEPDDVPDGYQATRAFYRSNGFVFARDFAGYWTGDLPVLMIRVLGSAGSAGRR